MSGPKSRAYLLPFLRLAQDYCTNGYEEIAREIELKVTVDGVHQISILCLPDALHELVIGYLVSSGLINNPARIAAMHVDGENFAVEVQTRPEEVPPVTPPPPPVTTSLTANQARDLAAALTSVSVLFAHTGGVHTGGLADGTGKLLFVYEDTGRHNVIDKLYGRCLLDGLYTADKALLFSGRCTGQIIRKIAVMGLPIIIARGAPTTMAIRMAEERGITLVAFARPGRVSVYTHPERITVA